MPRLFFLLKQLVLVVCLATPGLAEMSHLDVTVTYRERIALPPDAQLEVQLLDVSKMDVAATRIAAQRVRMTGVPMTLQLAYDPEVIDQRMTYSVSAALHSEGRVRFRTTQSYPVLTRGGGMSVELVMEMMPDPAPQPVPLTGTVWVAEEIAGRPVEADRPPSLMISEDGALALFGGCNRFAGQVELGEGLLTKVGAMAGTMMACPEPVATLERDMLNAFDATTAYQITGDVLVLTDASGTPTLKLRPEAG